VKGRSRAGEKIFAEYKLEYGSDRIEMHVGAIKKGQRVLLLDDLIATGGTLAAGITLMEKVSKFCAKPTGRPWWCGGGQYVGRR